MTERQVPFPPFEELVRLARSVLLGEAAKADLGGVLSLEYGPEFGFVSLRAKPHASIAKVRDQLIASLTERQEIAARMFAIEEGDDRAVFHIRAYREKENGRRELEPALFMVDVMRVTKSARSKKTADTAQIPLGHIFLVIESLQDREIQLAIEDQVVPLIRRTINPL